MPLDHAQGRRSRSDKRAKFDFPMHLSPRCGAKTRSGKPCRAPAMPNRKCRMHGGASTGAPKGEANGNYRNGRFTNEAIERRRAVNALIQLMRETAKKVLRLGMYQRYLRNTPSGGNSAHRSFPCASLTALERPRVRALPRNPLG